MYDYSYIYQFIHEGTINFFLRRILRHLYGMNANYI